MNMSTNSCNFKSKCKKSANICKTPSSIQDWIFKRSKVKHYLLVLLLKTDLLGVEVAKIGLLVVVVVLLVVVVVLLVVVGLFVVLLVGT